MHQLYAHDQVLVEEFRRVLAVGAFADDDSRQMDDQVWTKLDQQAPDGRQIRQIALIAARGKEAGAAALDKPAVSDQASGRAAVVSINP